MGGQPFASHALATFPELEIAQIRRLQRQHWNAFKHATHLGGREREDDELLARFTDAQNDHALFIGWYDYAVAADQMPIEAQVHQIWYLALYPEKLDPKYPVGPIADTFPDLRGKARDVQKQMLNDVIANARLDRQVMNDPKTEKRPLVLAWP